MIQETCGRRALGYARVSTDEQAEAGYSLPDQEEKIRAHCLRTGPRLVEIIPDDFTGKILERPGLLRVSELAKAGAFDVLVCVKLDRLARQNYLRRQYEEWLAGYGIEVLFVEQHFEATPAGRLQRGIMGEFAEYEADLIRDRTMSGRLKKARERQVMPLRASPYGYRQITKAEAAVIPEFHGRAGALVVVETEAAVVRRIFEWYTAGSSLRSIATRLIGEGVPTAKGRYWTAAGVRNIIKNSTYTGRAYYGKFRSELTGTLTSGGNPRQDKTARPSSEWVPIPCPALVTEEVFQACQRRLDINRETLSGRPSEIWPLHGMVFCGVCAEEGGFARRCNGYTVRRPPASWRYYICNSKKSMEPGAFCGTSINADKLETLALDALRRAAEPNRLVAFALADAETRSAQAGDPHREISRLCAELGKLEDEEGRIADLLLAGISRKVVQQKVEALQRKRDHLNQQVAEARSRLVDVVSPEEATRRAERAAEHLQEALPKAENDPCLLQQLMRMFLEVRVYRDEEPQITARIPDLGK